MEDKKRGFGYWVSVLGAPIITGLILLCVYALKGVYPFGEGNVAFYDMAQALIPIYTHTYDVLHGTKNIFWDWYCGGGISMVDTSGNFLFSPFNLFFLFVKREMILESMSFFLMLKVCVCAGSMSFYFRNTYKNTNWYWHVLAGLLYASCGYMIQYHCNIQFLDMVALFPFLIYFTDRLFEEKKTVGYCLSLAMFFILSVYYTYMACIYLILYCFVHSMKLEKKEKKERAALLGSSTLVAGLLSAVISVPTLITLLESYGMRMDSHVFFERHHHKVFMLYGCEFLLAFLIVFAVLKRKEIKNYMAHLLMVVFMVLPIFVEMTNGYWHIGGYVEFPMRYGYMLTFSALCLIGKIVHSYGDTEKEQSKMRKVLYAGYCAGAESMALAEHYFGKLMGHGLIFT